jgi:hypothetical protein
MHLVPGVEGRQVFSKVNAPDRGIGVKIGSEETWLCLHNSKGSIMMRVEDEDVERVVCTTPEEPLGSQFLTILLTT